MTDPDLKGLEPVVGVYGLRTFRVSLDGNLLPLTQLSIDWAGGRCVARCAVGGDHKAPETACTCGIHSFRDRAHLAKQFAAADSLVAVVALEGATVEGDRGWRSQAAQVVAVWIAESPTMHCQVISEPQFSIACRACVSTAAPRRWSRPTRG